MPEYICECCRFTTAKKSTYNDHLKSKKHLNKINGCSSSNTVVSDITENEIITDTESVLRIKDLENELKLKEQEIENLKMQLKMKDEMISILKQQPIQQPIIQTIQQPTQQPTPQPTQQHIIRLPKQIIENLNNTRPDALPINKFLEIERYNEDKNKYIKSIEFKVRKENNLWYYNKPENITFVPNTETGLWEFSSYSNLIVNMFCSIIEKTKTHLCPIYCSDKKRNTFYIKTTDGWEKMTEDKMMDIVKLISRNMYNLSQQVSFNAKMLCQYYRNHYNTCYPNGCKSFDAFDHKYSMAYVSLSPTFNKKDPLESPLCKYEEQDRTTESNKIVMKHLTNQLSKITCDDAVKFKPMKEENITFSIEEESEQEEEE